MRDCGVVFGKADLEGLGLSCAIGTGETTKPDGRSTC